MASNSVQPTIQITPLRTQISPINQNCIICSASALNPNNPACLVKDNGDIITYIQQKGDIKEAVIDRMDGTRIASFDLPLSSDDKFETQKGPVICWASFQRHHKSNNTHHERKMLCVLSNPTTLHIFDVLGDVHTSNYEHGSIGPSGHTIPLPFRACALFSVNHMGKDTSHGLLILRTPSDSEPISMEVPFSPEGLSIPGTPKRHNEERMDDGLRMPPEPVRLNFQRDDFIDVEEDEVVPSLFSLCDPLDEIRPVGEYNAENENKDANVNFFSNMGERLVFVDSPRLFARHTCHSAESARTFVTPICVTYNQTLKRHAIWSLTKAIKPNAALPLWRTTGRAKWRSPQEKYENTMEQDETRSSTDIKEEISHDNIRTRQDEKQGVISSFSDIHPDFTITLLHQEDAGISSDHWETFNHQSNENTQRHVFLATDVSGIGDLILCILLPNCSSEGNGEPATLRRFCLNVDTGSSINDGPARVISVSTLRDIPCTSAQQIQAVPVPLAPFSMYQKGCRKTSHFHHHDLNTMANDILIVQRSVESEDNGTKISLNRSGEIYMRELKLPPDVIENDFHLALLKNSAGERVDLVFTNNEDDNSITVRASISLIAHSSPITEMALRAIESAVIANNDSVREAALLSLLIRSDCVALSQFIKIEKNLSLKVDDWCWYALTIVLLNLWLGYKNDQPALGEVRSPTSAWEEILQSDFHATFLQGEGKLIFDNSMMNSLLHPQKDEHGMHNLSRYLNILLSTQQITDSRARISSIFDALHMLHENSRLMTLSQGSVWTRRIGSLLLRVCELNSPFMIDFEDHYHRLLGSKRCQSNACDLFERTISTPSRISNFYISPCIMTSLDTIISRDENNPGDACCTMAGFNDLINYGLNGTCSASWMIMRLFRTLFGDDIDNDSCVVVAMLDEGIRKSNQLQDELPLSILYPLLETLNRCRLSPPQLGEISDHMSNISQCPIDDITLFYELIGRNDLAALSTKDKNEINTMEATTNSEDADMDGLVALEDYSSMIFPEDNRIREAARLLRSSRSVFLRVPRPVELSDHDYERSKQEKLILLCRRSIALPLGRGMITLGTHNIQSSEQLFIPNIVLAGRVPPTNNTLALDMSNCPPNFRVWPEFHNGVAAGLRLPHAQGKDARKRIITRTWIKYNKPISSHQQDSGSNNSSTQIPPSYAHGGFLMALGLRGYLSALTTTDLMDYLTQGTITTTVGIFIGMAANKRGSCDPSVSKMLCLHIPSLLPPSFTPMDIASPVQAAAVAGIGVLYQGSAHRLMTEFLINEIAQSAKEQSADDKEGFALVCGLALGMVNLQKGTSTLSGLEDLRIEERLQRYIFGASDEVIRNSNSRLNVNRQERDKEHNTESCSINRDITAPGATLALGLMYIRSHNASIASMLDLPNTHYLLDFVRPDLLALRVISRSLVLWDEVEPTREWIDTRIPDVIKKSIDFMKHKAMAASNMDPENMTVDASVDDISDFDPQAVRQANAFIISGSCFSLGLRYAGSANRSAAAAIFERVLFFLELRDNKDLVNQVQKPDNQSLMTCLCTAAISLAMVMAGTGDIDSFRLFRAMRWRCEGTLYGTHQAFGAAIGLLFLGGGKCTLGSSPRDVAMLIAAFFPHFPILGGDNRYHLQALRHLYALATYDRILESIDIESGEKVCIPMQLTNSVSNKSIEVSTPYLLSSDAEFTEMRTKSDRYYPIVIHPYEWKDALPTLFIKRKPGHLSYLEDPNALQSLSLQTKGDSFLSSISMFSNDPVLSSFAKYFSTTNQNNGVAPFERLCYNISNECMRKETSDMVPHYLKLFRIIESFDCDKIDVQTVWDVRLLQSYMERKRCFSGEPLNLMNSEFIALVCQKLDDLFMTLPDLNSVVHSDRWWIGADSVTGPLLVWNDIPKKVPMDSYLR